MGIMDAFIEDMKFAGAGEESPKLTAARLAAIQSENKPAATASDIGIHVEVKDEADRPEADRLLGIINEYLARFVSGPCPNCGRLHGFSWGICTGEGNCRCGYPGRAIHDLGDEVGTLSNRVLWYDPAGVKKS